MKTIYILILTCILSGCSAKTITVHPIDGHQCSGRFDNDSTRALISEEQIPYKGRSISKCTYIKVIGDTFGGFMIGGTTVGADEPGKVALKDEVPYDIYVVQTPSTSSKSLEEVKNSVDEHDRQIEKYVEVRDSNNQARKANVEKYGMICKVFFVDLSNKTNLDINNIIRADPAKDGAYNCVGRGVLETPFGIESVQVELFGNPESGVYEYSEYN